MVRASLFPTSYVGMQCSMTINASFPDDIGLMVCGHGSRDAGASEQFSKLVDKLATATRPMPVAHGYLEFATPIIREGLDSLRARGIKQIVAVPGMLFAAGHVKNDIPSVLNTYACDHDVEILMARDLGIDARLLKAAADRIKKANAARGYHSLDDTALVVIGRGTSDSDANGNVAKVMRMLWEGMGFAHAEIGYSGVAHPRVDVILERTARLGFKRIVVFPYFLFTGVLVRRIYDQTDAVAAAHPEIEFVKAGYLNDHDEVINTFVERVIGVFEKDTAMNCQLCKYRTQILGHEASHGAPQESHHHHVEGIGTDGHHHHGHHDHHHGHRHATNGHAVAE